MRSSIGREVTNSARSLPAGTEKGTRLNRAPQQCRALAPTARDEIEKPLCCTAKMSINHLMVNYPAMTCFADCNRYNISTSRQQKQ
jgi:hypothetical protein